MNLYHNRMIIRKGRRRQVFCFWIFSLSLSAFLSEKHAFIPGIWYYACYGILEVMAAEYAADHGDLFAGLILLAAYPVREIPSSISEILLIGSEDTVINRDKVEKSRQYAPEDYTEHVIEGGCHAQFGHYGRQKGDGTPSITAEMQTEETVQAVTEFLRKRSEVLH